MSIVGDLDRILDNQAMIMRVLVEVLEEMSGREAHETLLEVLEEMADASHLYAHRNDPQHRE